MPATCNLDENSNNSYVETPTIKRKKENKKLNLLYNQHKYCNQHKYSKKDLRNAKFILWK